MNYLREASLIDSWVVKDVWKEGLVFRTFFVEAYHENSHEITSKYFTFWLWRDADYISKYIDLKMKAEFELIQLVKAEREKFLALHGEK